MFDLMNVIITINNFTSNINGTNSAQLKSHEDLIPQ